MVSKDTGREVQVSKRHLGRATCDVEVVRGELQTTQYEIENIQK